MELIYKIVPAGLWRQAEETGAFAGAPVDRRDGFIHFSTAAQVRETAAKYFTGARDLLLVGVDSAWLGENLRFEPSRNGALFPHFYAPLDLTRVVFARPLPLGADGAHCFEGLLP